MSVPSPWQALKPAELCQSIPDVRAEVDALDLELVAMLSRRFTYMAAAARIKTARTAVRDEARKEAVIANVSCAAFEAGLPRDLVEHLWEALVEASITYELAIWDELHI